jgi:hypothetical protein
MDPVEPQHGSSDTTLTRMPKVLFRIGPSPKERAVCSYLECVSISLRNDRRVAHRRRPLVHFKKLGRAAITAAPVIGNERSFAPMTAKLALSADEADAAGETSAAESVARPAQSYLVPTNLPGYFVSLLNSIGANDPSCAHHFPQGHLLYEGTQLVGCYDTNEEAQAALRARFEEHHPGEPFSPEIAWHGADGQGRTRWSYCIITIPKLDGPSRREAIERAYNDALLAQQQEEREKRPHTELKLVEDGVTFSGEDVFRVSVMRAVKKQTAPWPDPQEFDERDPTPWLRRVAAKRDVMDSPYLSAPVVFERLQHVLSHKQKAQLSNPQTDERLRIAIVSYLVAYGGNDPERLKAAARAWQLGELRIEDGIIKRCPEWGHPKCSGYHTRDEFCSDDCAARFRNRGRQKIGNGKSTYENAQARRDKKAKRHFEKCRLRREGQYCAKCETYSVPMSHADALNRRSKMKLENVEKAIASKQSGRTTKRPTGADEMDN